MAKNPIHLGGSRFYLVWLWVWLVAIFNTRGSMAQTIQARGDWAAPATSYSKPIHLALYANYLYMVGEGRGTIMDISNPSLPTQVGGFYFGFNTEGVIVVSGSNLFIVHQNKVSIYDL